MSRRQAPSKLDSVDLAVLRDRLFETGSSYAPVERSEIVGIDSLVDQLEEAIHWLKNPSLFARYNARLEPGILFSGDPGTGKTMLARYLASCSNALFIAVRDWPVSSDMVTATDVADLFQRARDFHKRTGRPVLIFWDEFEIYAKRRVESSARDASVVSQLMSELDGVNGKCNGILFVGCTNYENAIDTALKRHGRLGKRYAFTAPDRKGKKCMLEYYLGRHTDIDGLDLDSASYFLPSDASAATIEEACESVWRRALENAVRYGGEPVVTQAVLNDVLLDELLGPPPPFTSFDRETERRVALHELGHALVARALGVAIQIMTIRAGSDTFGRVFTVSNEERGFFNADQHMAQITVGLGALAMEKRLGIVVSSGVRGDTKHATELAIGLVEQLGQHSWNSVANWGPMNTAGLEQRASYADAPIISAKLLEYFDREESRVLVDCYNHALAFLETIEESAIYELGDRFVEAKTWTGKQFEAVCAELIDGQTKAAKRQMVLVD